VYDMYPWDSRTEGRRSRRTAPPAPRDGASPEGAEGPEGAKGLADQEDPAPATQAVQVALDRRDNGGAAGSQLARAGTASVLTRQ